MYAEERAYDKKAHAAQVADLMALLEHLDIDGSVRAARPRITVIGPMPENFEVDPKLEAFRWIAERKRSSLRVADAVAMNTRTGMRLRVAQAMGHEAVYGTAAEKMQRWREMAKAVEEILGRNPRMSRRAAAEQLTGKFQVSARTIADKHKMFFGEGHTAQE